MSILHNVYLSNTAASPHLTLTQPTRRRWCCAEISSLQLHSRCGCLDNYGKTRPVSPFEDEDSSSCQHLERDLQVTTCRALKHSRESSSFTEKSVRYPSTPPPFIYHNHLSAKVYLFKMNDEWNYLLTTLFIVGYLNNKQPLSLFILSHIVIYVMLSEWH